MNIAIIGAGNAGGALAKGWAKAGHSIILAILQKEGRDIAFKVLKR